jgi:HKD family nuclease
LFTLLSTSLYIVAKPAFSTFSVSFITEGGIKITFYKESDLVCSHLYVVGDLIQNAIGSLVVGYRKNLHPLYMNSACKIKVIVVNSL